MEKSIQASFFLVVISMVLSVYLYPQMPDRMASHWNISGEADGYSAKALAMFLMPAISLILLGFFMLIPSIDPLKGNIKEFRKYYDGFVLVLTAFLFYLHLLTIAWNLGYAFSMSSALSPAFGVLFYYTGVLIGKTKRNWFIGIRTPWTLSSDVVWERTHKIGGRLFSACGIIALLGLFFPEYAIALVIVPVMAVAVYTVIYSYSEYRKTVKE